MPPTGEADASDYNSQFGQPVKVGLAGTRESAVRPVHEPRLALNLLRSGYGDIVDNTYGLSEPGAFDWTARSENTARAVPYTNGHVPVFGHNEP